MSDRKDVPKDRDRGSRNKGGYTQDEAIKRNENTVSFDKPPPTEKPKKD